MAGPPLQIWLYLPHTLKPSGLALRAACLAPSARDTELSSKPDLPSSRSPLGGRGAESTALEPISELFKPLSPILLSLLKCPRGHLPLWVPLTPPSSSKGHFCCYCRNREFGGPRSTEQLHQSSKGSSVPPVLEKPNQRQSLNASCSRPIKTLLQCRLPLLKSDIPAINKSEGQGKALIFFFLLVFLPYKKKKKSPLL